MTRPLVTLLVLLLATLGSGCATGSTARVARVDRTDGLTMKVLWHEGRSAAALYQVDKWGTLAFGGGRDAFADLTTWEGPLTDDEITELSRLVSGWYDADPRGGGDSDAEIDVSLSGPRGRTSFTVPDDARGVQPVLVLLKDAARRRLQADLDTLPRPSDL